MDDLAFLRKRDSDDRRGDDGLHARRRCWTRASPPPRSRRRCTRPSTYRFIVHTHDFATQALTDTPHPSELVREALGEEVVYVDYVRPGFPLAHAVMRMGRLPEEARGMVLGRHGLVAWGDSAKDCYANLHRLINQAEEFIAARGRSGRRSPSQGGRRRAGRRRPRRRPSTLLPSLRGGIWPRVRPVILHLDDSPEALAFAGDARAARGRARRGMATPEHILRCGRLPLFVDADLATLPVEDARRAMTAALDRYADELPRRLRAPSASRRSRCSDPVPRVVLLPGAGPRDGDEGQGQRRRRQPLLPARHQGDEAAERWAASASSTRPTPWSSSTGRSSW